MSRLMNVTKNKKMSIKKFANDDKRIDRLIDRIDVWNKLFWVIASSSIGALVVSFVELIIK